MRHGDSGSPPRFGRWRAIRAPARSRRTRPICATARRAKSSRTSIFGAPSLSVTSAAPDWLRAPMGDRRDGISRRERARHSASATICLPPVRPPRDRPGSRSSPRRPPRVLRRNCGSAAPPEAKPSRSGPPPSADAVLDLLTTAVPAVTLRAFLDALRSTLASSAPGLAIDALLQALGVLGPSRRRAPRPINSIASRSSPIPRRGCRTSPPDCPAVFPRSSMPFAVCSAAAAAAGHAERSPTA